MQIGKRRYRKKIPTQGVGVVCEGLSNLFCHIPGQRLSRNEDRGYKNQLSSRNISSTKFNAKFSLFINNMFVTLQSALNQCTVQTFTESEDTRCCVKTIFPPEDGHVNARNMSRIIV